MGTTFSTLCVPANAALATTDSINSAAIADFIMPDIFIIWRPLILTFAVFNPEHKAEFREKTISPMN